MNEFGHGRLAALDEGEGHHRWGDSAIAHIHRKLVHEVADGGLGGALSVIGLGGQKVARHLQLLAEKADLFWLGFKVRPVLIGEDKVEYGDALPYELDFMLAAIAKVLASDLAIEPAREEVIHG